MSGKENMERMGDTLAVAQEHGGMENIPLSILAHIAFRAGQAAIERMNPTPAPCPCPNCEALRSLTHA